MQQAHALASPDSGNETAPGADGAAHESCSRENRELLNDGKNGGSSAKCKPPQWPLAGNQEHACAGEKAIELEHLPFSTKGLVVGAVAGLHGAQGSGGNLSSADDVAGGSAHSSGSRATPEVVVIDKNCVTKGEQGSCRHVGEVQAHASDQGGGGKKHSACQPAQSSTAAATLLRCVGDKEIPAMQASKDGESCNVVRSQTGAGQRRMKRYGKLVLVDLAGSERLKESGSSGAGAAETGAINRSLFTLGQVLHALSSRRESQANPPPVIAFCISPCPSVLL
jgi:hypothetical protein